MLTGEMMDFPLTLTHFLVRANTFFPKREVVTRTPDGSLHRYTYRDFYRRTCRLANALTKLGVKPGDRVGSLCWNHYRHLELYFGVPAMGAVLHTLNLRLHANDLHYIADHAGDRVIVVDRSLLPLFNQFREKVRSLEHVVVIPDDGPVKPGDVDYEALLSPEKDQFEFPKLDERAAALMCYTSGTTGNPKGVLYSHRSTTLHTLAACAADCLAVSESDTILPVVPMFHANVWGLPYAAVASGSKLVFPGPKLDADSILDLIARERVTMSAGVPTIWLGMLALLDEQPKKYDVSTIRSFVIGGSAAPPALIEGFKKRHGITVTHAWGMTETNPLGSIARVKHEIAQTGDPAGALHAQSSQGYAVNFVEQRHVSDTGAILPWDGATMGELEVRGPWVAASYYNNLEGADRFTKDGWFKTGDVVTIDAEGYLRITDRSKDVIKSGGEWISTVALENALMSHPSVLEAAVFAGQHPKWAERPLAAIVFKQGKSATKEDLTALLADKFAKFWLPDDYLFMAAIPKTSTGKFLKMKLRQDHGDHLLKTGPAKS